MALIKRNTAYSVNDIVNTKYGTKLKCTTAGTTSTDPLILDGTSPITDGTVVWEVQEEQGGSGQGLVDYEANKNYSVGDIVIYDDKIYKCTTAHTSTATFDDTKWEELSAGGISIWQASTSYNVGDVVIDGNLIWQCVTAHISTSTFDESKWVCISGGEISNGYEIVPLWEGSLRFNDNTPQQLNDSIGNYDFLLFNIGVGSTRSNSITELIDVKDISSTVYYRLFGGHPDYTFHAEIRFSGSTQFYIDDYIEKNGVDAYIYKVQGIRKAKPIVSSGMKYETLWEGEAGSYSGSGDYSITLSEPVNKYKKLGLSLVSLSSGNVRKYYEEIDVADYIDLITNGNSGDMLAYGKGSIVAAGWHAEIYSSSTNTQISFHSDKTCITKVTGISEGVVIPTGVQAARVTLWEGSYNTSNESASNINNTITLNDSITNYDCVEITFAGSGSRDNIVTEQYDVSNYIIDNYAIVSFGHSSMYAEMNFKFVDATHFAIMYKRNSTWDGKILKITGIKYIQPDSYSTEEKLIGTWIDGKPLYQKTVNCTLPSSTGVQLYSYLPDIPFSSIDTLVNVDGFGIRNDGWRVQHGFYAGDNFFFVEWHKANSQLYFYVVDPTKNQPVTLTFKYTKTTD